MENLKYVIEYIYNLSSTTYLTFGRFTFSIFAMWVSLAGLSLTMWGLHKIFDR